MPYITQGKLRMINVYVREAHPSDGWEIEANNTGEVASAAVGVATKISYTQTFTLDARLAVARKFKASLTRKLGDLAEASIPLLVDDPSTNALDIAYEAPPEKLVLIDAARRVLFCSGQGPFQYSIAKLREYLESNVEFGLECK
eukprot:TRINITY_DN58996_c0_g1_i1.p1 TRINITY_DN58996_c0_g1~~TRINITY_DN58996_c0_g1_i1.p1  ORF type:complete len:144 (-),score=19.53 TRINITY_DN58996_c0_g1_i1:367-798(-)